MHLDGRRTGAVANTGIGLHWVPWLSDNSYARLRRQERPANARRYQPLAEGVNSPPEGRRRPERVKCGAARRLDG